MSYIFISYSHKDKSYVQKLVAELEQHEFVVWYTTQIDYGSQWPNILQEKVDNCAALILIMTSHSYEREWVQNELNRAKRKHKHIFPLLLEGEEPWLSVEATQYVDVRDARMPPETFYQRLARVVPPRVKPSSKPENHITRVNVEQVTTEKLDAIIKALIEVKQKNDAEPKRSLLVGQPGASLKVGKVFVDYVTVDGFFSIERGWSASINGEDVETHLRPKLENMGWLYKFMTPTIYYSKRWAKEGVDLKIIANDLMEINEFLGVQPYKLEIVIKY